REDRRRVQPEAAAHDPWHGLRDGAALGRGRGGLTEMKRTSMSLFGPLRLVAGPHPSPLPPAGEGVAPSPPEGERAGVRGRTSTPATGRTRTSPKLSSHSKRSKGCPASTSCPDVTSTAATVPSCSARTSLKTFIASIT